MLTEDWPIPNHDPGFKALFLHAAVGILVQDPAGKIEMANPHAAALFGYQPSELTGQSFEELLPHHIRHKYRDAFLHAPGSSPLGINMDLDICKKDGSLIPVQVCFACYNLDNTSKIAAFISDISMRKRTADQLSEEITERKKAEQDLQRLNEELENRVKEKTKELLEFVSLKKAFMEIKSRFVSTASHEFRTPLSIILSSNHLIGKYTLTEQQEKREKHIRRIDTAVKNLNSILNDFLSVEKLEQGKIIPSITSFNFPEFINNLIDELRWLVKPGQQIIYSHHGDSVVAFDKQIVSNIFLNLLSNAIKYSEINVEVFSTVTNSDITLSVADKGIGIPEGEQGRIFEKFFRAKNAENIQGTGLGLNIVKGNLELINGSLQFTSNQDRGTTFTVVVPHPTVNGAGYLS